ETGPREGVVRLLKLAFGIDAHQAHHEGEGAVKRSGPGAVIDELLLLLVGPVVRVGAVGIESRVVKVRDDGKAAQRVPFRAARRALAEAPQLLTRVGQDELDERDGELAVRRPAQT